MSPLALGRFVNMTPGFQIYGLYVDRHTLMHPTASLPLACSTLVLDINVFDRFLQGSKA